MTERVQGVVTRQGNDISDTCNRLGEAHGVPPRVLVACGIGESDLDEHAERYGTWPDVSFGLCQQAVAYAPMGDRTGSIANISIVRAALFDVTTALETAAPQLAAFWQQYQDGPETLGRYNWPARGLQDNPNRPNIERAWAASVQYVAPEGDVPVPDLTEQWIAAMEALTGTPYVFGGKDVGRDGGLDCSGLLTSTARTIGLELGDPDMTSADGLKAYCDAVAKSDVRRGDVVLFSQTYGDGGPDYATHCGVHLHDTVMIDEHDSVHETDYGQPYWQEHLLGFFRPRGLAGDDGDDMARIQELETVISEMQRVATEEVLPNLDKALGTKLSKVAREALESGAKPAAATIARAGAPE